MSWSSPETRVMDDERQLIRFSFHCKDSLGTHILEFDHFFPVSQSEYRQGTPAYWDFVKGAVDPMQNHMDDCLQHSSKLCHVCSQRPADRVLLATKLISASEIPVMKNLTTVVCETIDCAITAKESMAAASRKLDRYLADFELALWPNVALPVSRNMNSATAESGCGQGRASGNIKHTRSASLGSATYEIVSNLPPTTAQPQLLNFQPRRLSPICSSLQDQENARAFDDKIEECQSDFPDQGASYLRDGTSLTSANFISNVRTYSPSPTIQVADEKRILSDNSPKRIFTLIASSDRSKASDTMPDTRSQDIAATSQLLEAQAIQTSTPVRSLPRESSVGATTLGGSSSDRRSVPLSGPALEKSQIAISGDTSYRSSINADQEISRCDSLGQRRVKPNGFLQPYEGQQSCITVKRTISKDTGSIEMRKESSEASLKVLGQESSTTNLREQNTLQSAMRKPPAVAPPQVPGSIRQSRSIDILAALRELPPGSFGGPTQASRSLAESDEGTFGRKWIATTKSLDFRPVSAFSTRAIDSRTFNARYESEFPDLGSSRCQSMQEQHRTRTKLNPKETFPGRFRRVAEKIGIRKTKSIDCFGNRSALVDICGAPRTRLSRCLESDGRDYVTRDGRSRAFDGSFGL